MAETLRQTDTPLMTTTHAFSPREISADSLFKSVVAAVRAQSPSHQPATSSTHHQQLQSQLQTQQILTSASPPPPPQSSSSLSLASPQQQQQQSPFLASAPPPPPPPQSSSSLSLAPPQQQQQSSFLASAPPPPQHRPHQFIDCEGRLTTHLIIDEDEEQQQQHQNPHYSPISNTPLEGVSQSGTEIQIAGLMTSILNVFYNQ
ncbi:hypothetical protein niasHT_015073 [Heterodera trifolii]|uniref:Uncharacterized protein n=1 Tax=Heterodera trifolii TaxID=157864 RepID=A0ABD2L9F6_9BILA